MNNRQLLTFLFIAFFTITSNAQQKYTVSLGGGYSSYKASGNAKNASGLGIDITAKANLSESVEAFAQTGYNAYLNNGFNVAFIPMLLGANIKFNDFKAGMGIGYGSSTAGGSTKGGFTYSPQIGYQINNVDLVVHYTSTNISDRGTGTWNMFGFKILHKLF
jgi:hypothetical protein